MVLRIVTLLIILAGVGYELDREQRAGRFQEADDRFLDFLVANARDRFVVPEGATTDRVVLVRMREEDRAEYSAWPPQPIDWQMVLKGLAAVEPEVVVVPTPLVWGEPAPEFVGQAGQALLSFTSVVLGAEARLDGEARDAGAGADLKSELPMITRCAGETGLLPRVVKVTAMPDKALRSGMELGIVPAPVADGLPLVVRAGGGVVPSLLLQALTHATHTPYARQRVRAGPGAGAHLGGGLYVPLSNDGTFMVKAGMQVPAVSALDFLTGTLADSLSAEDKAKLGKGRIIVIGIDHDGGAGTSARSHAGALAQVLLLPRIHLVGDVVRWIVCGVAALLGCVLLRNRGGKAFRSGLLLIFLALVAGYLVFQSNLTWFPPTVPAALLATSTLFAMIFGPRKRSPPPVSS